MMGDRLPRGGEPRFRNRRSPIGIGGRISRGISMSRSPLSTCALTASRGHIGVSRTSNKAGMYCAREVSAFTVLVDSNSGTIAESTRTRENLPSRGLTGYLFYSPRGSVLIRNAKFHVDSRRVSLIPKPARGYGKPRYRRQRKYLFRPAIRSTFVFHGLTGLLLRTLRFK